LTLMDLMVPIMQAMRQGGAPGGSMPAGITYLGQMIAHDIVPAHGRKTARRNTNLITTRYLNLSSLYGTAKIRKNLNMVDGEAQFILAGKDLKRDKKGAMIPEGRNDENVLISQLHHFWLDFHNKIVKYLLKHVTNNDLKFNIAHMIVVSIFKRVILDDFMYHMLDKAVYEFYLGHTGTVIYNNQNKYTAIPDEFAHAALRSGHSLVRQRYILDKGSKVKLDELFTKDKTLPLNPKFHIHEWEQLFGLKPNGRAVQEAAQIDLYFAKALGRLKMGRRLPKNLVAANLRAGLKSKLPNGGEAVDWILRRHPAMAQKVDLDKISQEEKKWLVGTIIDGIPNFTARDLPLWLYILVENNTKRKQGHTLGRVGSIVLAEVLINAMLPPNATFQTKNHNLYCSDDEQVKTLVSTLIDEKERLTMMQVINISRNMSKKEHENG
jgi:hypothetical protein